jgi:hypothetical protein
LIRSSGKPQLSGPKLALEQLPGHDHALDLVGALVDLGVLRGLDPPDPGLDLSGRGVPLRGGVGVGGGELGGQQRGAAGAEDMLGEELADYTVEQGLGA